MPKGQVAGRKGVYLDFEEETLASVHALAQSNGRAFREEVMHAIARHLEAPPKVRVVVETPPLPEAEIDQPKPARKKKTK